MEYALEFRGDKNTPMDPDQTEITASKGMTFGGRPLHALSRVELIQALVEALSIVSETRDEMNAFRKELSDAIGARSKNPSG